MKERRCLQSSLNQLFEFHYIFCKFTDALGGFLRGHSIFIEEPAEGFVSVLEPAVRDSSDATLIRLLEEVREQQAIQAADWHPHAPDGRISAHGEHDPRRVVVGVEIVVGQRRRGRRDAGNAHAISNPATRGIGAHCEAIKPNAC